MTIYRINRLLCVWHSGGQNTHFVTFEQFLKKANTLTCPFVKILLNSADDVFKLGKYITEMLYWGNHTRHFSS